MSTKEQQFDVCEMFSPHRMTSVAAKIGLRGGWAMDIASACNVTGSCWDLLRDRVEARRLLNRDAPGLRVLSPPCI